MGQIRLRQIGSAQAGAGEIGIAEAGGGQIGFGQVRAAEQSAAKIALAAGIQFEQLDCVHAGSFLPGRAQSKQSLPRGRAGPACIPPEGALLASESLARDILTRGRLGCGHASSTGLLCPARPTPICPEGRSMRWIFSAGAAFALAALMGILLAMPAAAETFPDFEQLPARPELPDPLVMFDGTAVKTAADWHQKRKPELKRLFQHYMYGELPAAQPISAREISRDENCLGGKATRREVALSLGPADCPPIHLLIVAPKSGRPARRRCSWR